MDDCIDLVSADSGSSALFSSSSSVPCSSSDTDSDDSSDHSNEEEDDEVSSAGAGGKRKRKAASPAASSAASFGLPMLTAPVPTVPVDATRFDRKGSVDTRATVDAFHTKAYGERAALYENDGEGNVRDVALERGLDKVSLTMGANFGDLDNDGFLDFTSAPATRTSMAWCRTSCTTARVARRSRT